MSTLLLAELLRRRVRLEPHEAVAIAQQLIECGGAAPSPDNVRLNSDGSVECVGTDATPAPYELAIFLQTLLPFDRVGIPGGLRYAIARSLHEVEALPFDSLDDLSRALQRFERGDRRAVVAALVERALAAVAPAPSVPVATAPARIASPAPVLGPVPVPMPARRTRTWRMSAAAAALVGCTLGSIVTAGLMTLGHRGRTTLPNAPASLSRTATASVPAPTPPVPRATPAVPRAAVTVAGAESRMTSTPAAAASISRTPSASTGAAPASEFAKRAARPRAFVQSRAVVGGTPDSSAAVVAALDAKQRPVFSPAFASNESALFFHTGGSHDARSALAVSNGSPGYDLQVMTILDDGARNYHVQPSPDGRAIAFDSDRDGERGVYVAKRDGTDVRRVSGSGYAAVPTWSPDGRRLAYIRAEASNPKVWNLWIQSLDDGRTKRLTNYKYGQTWSASWFPDNRRVCYSHEDKLVIVNLETGGEQVIASPMKGRLVRTPAVSPDGTKVIFQVFRQGAWMLNVPDGSLRFVLTDPTAEEFAWAPDGRHVAFHSRRDGQWGIYVIAG